MYRIPLEETILRDHNLEDHNLDSYTTFKLFELLSSGNMADVSTADGKVANIGPKISEDPHELQLQVDND